MSLVSKPVRLRVVYYGLPTGWLEKTKRKVNNLNKQKQQCQELTLTSNWKQDATSVTCVANGIPPWLPISSWSATAFISSICTRQ